MSPPPEPNLLRYVSAGVRNFGVKPIEPYARPWWEIYAVTHGRIAPWYEEWEEPLQESTLWLLRATQVHGWKGDPGHAAMVAVFQFDDVPPALRELTHPTGVFSVRITADEADALARMARDILPHFWKRGSLLQYHSQRLLMDLAILILGKAVAEDESPVEAVTRVSAAENWFWTHLSERPTLTNLACETGTTEGNLRRLFLSERNCSPKVAMTRIQVERAAELLLSTSHKLDVVAAECGFSDASAFCRVFKRVRGITPAAFRKAISGMETTGI
jgi:AraC-like DNA-binding protein